MGVLQSADQPLLLVPASHACYLLQGVVPETHTHFSHVSQVFLASRCVWPTQLLHWAPQAHPGSSDLLAALFFSADPDALAL